MMYKIVFFTYIAAAAAVIAAVVLFLIIRHQDRQYEKGKLQALVGLLIGSLLMNTQYFLSYTDSLANLERLYLPIERGMDILCSYIINLFLFLFLYQLAKENDPRARRLLRPGLVILTGAFVFAGIVYVAVVTDEYRPSAGHLMLTEIAQIALTSVICLVTIVGTWEAVRGGALSPGLSRPVFALGLINVVTAVYNGVGSIAVFLKQFAYTDWSGLNDFNTWLFIFSDLTVLAIILWYYRRQEETLRADTSPPAIPEELGLTQREKEIALLVLQRHTYDEIAEELTISKYTVKRHVHNIYEKAGVSRRDELIRKLAGANPEKEETL